MRAGCKESRRCKAICKYHFHNLSCSSALKSFALIVPAMVCAGKTLLRGCAFAEEDVVALKLPVEGCAADA